MTEDERSYFENLLKEHAHYHEKLKADNDRLREENERWREGLRLARSWIDQEHLSEKDPRIVYVSGNRKNVEAAVKLVKELVNKAPVPGGGPVDHQRGFGFPGRRQHAVGLLQGRRHRFFRP